MLPNAKFQKVHASEQTTNLQNCRAAVDQCQNTDANHVTVTVRPKMPSHHVFGANSSLTTVTTRTDALAPNAESNLTKPPQPLRRFNHTHHCTTPVLRGISSHFLRRSFDADEAATRVSWA